MTPRDKAIELVDIFRMILMNENTDCGNEILCTTIATKHAIIVCDEALSQAQMIPKGYKSSYHFFLEVRKILNEL